MKKLIILLVILTGLKLRADAQDEHLLKAEFGVVGFPGEKLGSTGLMLGLEEITAAKWVYGIRGQLIYAGSGYYYAPVCVTGEHNLGNALFAGVGTGVYAQDDPQHLKGARTKFNFGCFPRFGVDIKHFRISIEYDYTGGTANYAGIASSYFFTTGEQL